MVGLELFLGESSGRAPELCPRDLLLDGLPHAEFPGGRLLAVRRIRVRRRRELLAVFSLGDRLLPEPRQDGLGLGDSRRDGVCVFALRFQQPLTDGDDVRDPGFVDLRSPRADFLDDVGVEPLERLDRGVRGLAHHLLRLPDLGFRLFLVQRVCRLERLPLALVEDMRVIPVAHPGTVAVHITGTRQKGGVEKLPRVFGCHLRLPKEKRAARGFPRNCPLVDEWGGRLGKGASSRQVAPTP